jgi:hypothetical protein
LRSWQSHSPHLATTTRLPPTRERPDFRNLRPSPINPRGLLSLPTGSMRRPGLPTTRAAHPPLRYCGAVPRASLIRRNFGSPRTKPLERSPLRVPLGCLPPFAIDPGLGVATRFAARHSAISRDGAAMEVLQWLCLTTREAGLGHGCFRVHLAEPRGQECGVLKVLRPLSACSGYPSLSVAGIRRF